MAALFVTGCGSTSDSRSTGQVIDDTAIHTKVKAALVNDPVVSGTAINVDVERGVVVLTGAVNGDVEKTKAEDIARGVNGVRTVENHLVVRQAQPSANRTQTQ
jgi:osmotically-inducible protein OsmY